MTDRPKPEIPGDFIKQMEELLPKDEIWPFFESLKAPVPTSIRINPFKIKEPHFPNAQPIPWAHNAFWLKERPNFTIDPSFHSGAYYVQEASSTFLQHVLENLSLPEESIFLDLCAAPGGKSTLLSTHLGEKGMLIANEVINSRTQALKENIIKWGLGNTIVTQNDPSHFRGLGDSFDLVLVDAPCSGEGMFRKDPDAINEWSKENVQLCASRQVRILEAASNLVRPGGYLVYSTCTFNTSENEQNVNYLLDQGEFNGVNIPIEEEWKIIKNRTEYKDKISYSYRFFPHKVNGEGLYMAVFQKIGETSPMSLSQKRNFKHPHIKQVLPKQHPLPLNFAVEAGLRLYQIGDTYFGLPSAFVTVFEKAANLLNIRYFGIELGDVIRNTWIPSHPYALSLMPKDNFESFSLDHDLSLFYLKKMPFSLENAPKGWLLFNYKGLDLGWCKNLGNRLNNYYPKTWRIRME